MRLSVSIEASDTAVNATRGFGYIYPNLGFTGCEAEGLIGWTGPYSCQLAQRAVGAASGQGSCKAAADGRSMAHEVRARGESEWCARVVDV